MKKRKYYYKQFPESLEALKRDNYKCVKCRSRDNVVVHHIDGSRKLGFKNINRSLDNLITLCRKCHAEAHGISLRWTKPNIDVILELHAQNIPYNEIGAHFGISRQRVHQLLKKYKEPSID